MVLEKLLGDGREEEARSYLSQLKEVEESLSWEVSTGNAAADALLGSKLALARQEGIRVVCDLKLPVKSGIKDMDWCMILANAMDNAIKACRKVDIGQRYLRLEGKRKGNFCGKQLSGGRGRHSRGRDRAFRHPGRGGDLRRQDGK